MPGPPLVSTLGRSTILNASIMRISTTVAATGATDGQVISRKIWKRRRAVELGGFDFVSRLALEGGQHDDEDEGNPLPAFAEHDDETSRPCVGRPGEIAAPKRLPKRRERADRHVGEHPERVGDADRRHHQRDEEDDAKETASADFLGAEPSKAGADGELDASPQADIEERGAERAELAFFADRRGESSRRALRTARKRSRGRRCREKRDLPEAT